MIRILRELSTIATISTWALFGAGISLSVMQIGAVLILWLGRWSPQMERDQLRYIGIIAVMLALDLMAVIASLAKARIAAKGLAGTGFDLSSGGTDAAPPTSQPGVKVTVETPQP
jgi:hypothetical protein